MRWDNLKVDAPEGAEQHHLPGHRDPAVIRRFDAPEAMDIRFYEVHAKSALNRVPERSRVPFPWTINPYRGCSHACSYCGRGDTQILLADGRQKDLSDVEVGDRVYGTRFDGKYRRYVTTEVLAHWRTRKRAYRTTLADGTELVTSGDHRFLATRGWKHVVGAMGGPLQRPYLTTNDSLLGVGDMGRTPTETAEYRHGYLAGMIRGDGTIGHYAGRGHSVIHAFRLALADEEALKRSRQYLAEIDVPTRAFAFSAATATRREVRAIRTGRREGVERIEDVIALPLVPGNEWARGFLAGIFDAEGCYSGSLRISNADPDLLGMIQGCLDRFGFSSKLEPPARNGVRCVRVTGGLREHLRFFTLVDPAITRKRRIAEDCAIKSDADLRVVSIEDLGLEIPMYDITTGTGDFIANGVVSHNCFARPTHTYLGFDAGRDFEREIVVKVNVPELLRAELRKPSWKGEHVALGTNTDPYQWVEGRYKLMPGIWEALRDARNPCSVLTKSPLLLRDIELFRELVQVTSFTACLSIPTLDEKAWRDTEPHTPNPKARLEAVRKLNDAGIPTGVLVAPLMPGINDAPEQVDALLQGAADAGAVSIGGQGLFLRGETRDVFMDWLAEKRPDLVERYERLYRRGAYLPEAEGRRLKDMVRGCCSRWREHPRGTPCPDESARPPGTLDGRKWAAHRGEGREPARDAPPRTSRPRVAPQPALF